MLSNENFIEVCDKLNIDFDKTFYQIYNASVCEGRVKCKSEYLERKAEQMFVVGFCKKQNLYFAWSLNDIKAKNMKYFSANISDIKPYLSDQIFFIEKNREFSGHGKENVFVFSPKNTENFLLFIKDKLYESSSKDV